MKIKKNSTVKMILIQKIRGIRFISSCYNTKAGIEALIIRFLLNPYELPMIGATVIAFIELINEKKIKEVLTNLNLTGMSNNVEIKAL